MIKDFIKFSLASILVFSSLSGTITFAECTNSSTQILNHTEGEGSDDSSNEGFGADDIVILDIQDSIRLLEEGNVKTAAKIMKSAIGQLREIDGLDKTFAKLTTKSIKAAIKLAKSGDIEGALEILDEVLADLSEELGIPQDDSTV